ncbi:MAG TPA: hypothetical protein VF746_17045 [Longimicrobium sp.]|jgi:hypothetical protein
MSIIGEIAGGLRIVTTVAGWIKPPPRLRELGGRWYSRYQREDDPHLGEWATDLTEVTVRWPRKLEFRNHPSPGGAEYRAEGRFRNEREIVGTWRETRPGATAGGTFHLYADAFGKKLYGICTGPTGQHRPIYGGWILAREQELLDRAQEELAEAMLVCRK